jgi:transcriptional regulator with XRE-family HTH domain
MEDFTSTKEPLGMGEKVARVRKLRRIKQEYLAEKLNISQTQVSNIEQQDEIEDELLDQIAAILGVPVEFIKTFDEDRVTNYIISLYDIHDNEVKDSTNTFIANQTNNHNTYNYYTRADELQEQLKNAQIELELTKQERDELKRQK